MSNFQYKYEEIEIDVEKLQVGNFYNGQKIIYVDPNWTSDCIKVEFEGNSIGRSFYKKSRILISRKVDS